jgi:hypothetical protein
VHRQKVQERYETPSGVFEFYFEPHSNYKLDGYSFVKTYYLQLSTGKEIPLLNLFEPTQRKALQDLLSTELNQILQSNKQYLTSFNWDQGSELGMYANDQDEYLVEEEGAEESQSAPTKDKTKLAAFTSQDLKHTFLNLNPFSAQFIRSKSRKMVQSGAIAAASPATTSPSPLTILHNAQLHESQTMHLRSWWHLRQASVGRCRFKVF